jgi:hypothetical protein
LRPHFHTHPQFFFAFRSHFPFSFLFSPASGIFLVLDRAYVLPLPGVRPLWEAGLACLRTHLATHPALTAKAVRGLLGAIERERGGEGAAARPLLKSLLRLLAALVRSPHSTSHALPRTCATFSAHDSLLSVFFCFSPARFAGHIRRRV